MKHPSLIDWVLVSLCVFLRLPNPRENKQLKILIKQGICFVQNGSTSVRPLTYILRNYVTIANIKILNTFAMIFYSVVKWYFKHVKK